MLLLTLGICGGYILAVLQNAGRLKGFPLVDKTLAYISAKIISAVTAMTGPPSP